MAEKSLKINNYNIKGKALQIYLSKPPKEGDSDFLTLYVSNLPFTITEDKIRAHFAEVGEI